MAAYVPPGWPAGVHPPGSEDFERTAQAWLLDVVPADYRLHGVLRRYPLALAAMAAHHAKACVAGARDGYRNARTEVGGALPPHALEALLAAYRAEGRRLVATAQAVDLVARALRGEEFTPRLEDAAPHTPPAPGTPPAPLMPASPGTPPAPGAPPGPGAPAAPRTPGAPAAPRTPAARPATERPASGQPAEQPAARRPAGDRAPARPSARDGAETTRKAPAQRPARNGGGTGRKVKRDQHAAAG